MDRLYCAFERRSFPQSDFVVHARHGAIHVSHREGPVHSASGYALDERTYPIVASLVGTQVQGRRRG